MMKPVKLFDYDEMEATDFYCRYTGLKEGPKGIFTNKEGWGMMKT